MEYISLGSNCSITYQLGKLGLRNNSYPFDWTKISLTQLIKILENDFYDYVDTIEYKKESSSHPLIDNNDIFSNPNPNPNPNSIIVSNIYGLIFAHEIASKYEIDEFKNKITTRIERFRNLTLNNKKIKFVRIELGQIKLNWKNQIIQLVSLLDTIIKEYELILIINKSELTTNLVNKVNNLVNSDIFPPNIKIHLFDNFSPDWRMDNLDWINIFI